MCRTGAQHRVTNFAGILVPVRAQFRQQPMSDVAHRPTHAGGVVFRSSADGRRYLLVRAKNPPTAWVFPKGHVEEGERAEDAAIREVLEEAGVRASIVAPLDGLIVGAQRIAMFLMAYEGEAGAPERERMWLAFEHAARTLTFPESQELLAAADAAVRRLGR